MDAAGKPRRSKGRSARSSLSINGRIEMRRRRWHAAGEGSDCPLDRLVDAARAAISVGVRELCCRLGLAGGSFARSAEAMMALESMYQSDLWDRYWITVLKNRN